MNLRAWIGAAAIAVAALWVSPQVGVVTSGSMAPYLNTGDGFLTLRLPPRQGSVVVYRPKVLDAEYVVHRVVGQTHAGLITKGDASAHADQLSGEPPVSRQRVTGVVVLRVPALGPLVERLLSVRDRFVPSGPGRWLLLALAGCLFLAGSRASRRERRRLWRVRVAAVVRALGAVVGVTALVAALAGSQTPAAVEYLVSQSPGTVPWHVAVATPGSVPLTVKNPGLLPVVFVARGLDGTAPDPAWGVVPPRGRTDIAIQVSPEPLPGWRRAYVDVYVYPLVSPPWLLAELGNLHPFLALTWVGAVPILLAAALARWAEGLPPLGRVLGVPRPRR